MERKEALMEQALPEEELEKAAGGAKGGECVKFFCRTCNKTIQDETIKYPPALTPRLLQSLEMRARVRHAKAAGHPVC